MPVLFGNRLPKIQVFHRPLLNRSCLVPAVQERRAGSKTSGPLASAPVFAVLSNPHRILSESKSLDTPSQLTRQGMKVIAILATPAPPVASILTRPAEAPKNTENLEAHAAHIAKGKVVEAAAEDQNPSIENAPASTESQSTESRLKYWKFPEDTTPGRVSGSPSGHGNPTPANRTLPADMATRLSPEMETPRPTT